MDGESPDIPVQRINQILKTVFELLWFEPQGLYVSEILTYVKNSIVLTEYEHGTYPYAPNFPRYEAIIRIGTIPFEKVGWLEKTRHGRWFITREGRKACLEFKDSDKFFEISAQIFNDWKTRENSRLALLEANPYFNPEEYSWEQIKQYIRVLDVKDIRVMINSLLKAMGCHILWEGSVAKDELVDIQCSMDPLGVKTPRLHINVLNKEQRLTREDVERYSQEAISGTVGVIFSFSGFDEGVKEYALSLKERSLRLIDLEDFVELWVENLGRIDQEGYAKFPLRPIHFLALPREKQLQMFSIKPRTDLPQ